MYAGYRGLRIPIVIFTGLLGNLLPAFLFGIAIKHSGESSLAGILNSLTPLFVITIGALVFWPKSASTKNSRRVGRLYRTFCVKRH